MILQKQNLIYHSVIPWVSFTSISNAQHAGKNYGIPKIVFGKYFEEGGVKNAYFGRSASRTHGRIACRKVFSEFSKKH